MIIALEQLAGLGIRNRLVRLASWIITSVIAAMLAFASAALGALPYVLLLGYAVWRLTVWR